MKAFLVFVKKTEYIVQFLEMQSREDRAFQDCCKAVRFPAFISS